MLFILLLWPMYTKYMFKNTLKCSKGKWGQYDNTKWKGGFIASREFIYLLKRLKTLANNHYPN